MIKMVLEECGGAMNHKWSLTTGCSASLTSITNIHLKACRYYFMNNNFLQVI